MERLSLFDGEECFLPDSLVLTKAKALDEANMRMDIVRVNIVLNMNQSKISSMNNWFY